MIRSLPITISEIDIFRVISKAVRTLREWRDRAAQRRHLGALDQHALRDIGMTRAQARFESRKPFWWY